MKADSIKLSIHKFNSYVELENELATFTIEKIKKSLVKSGCSTIALSGGQTPLNLYKKISKMNLDWSQVKLSLVDERFVSKTSKDSNQRNILDSFSLKADAFKEFNGFEYLISSKGLPELVKKNKLYDLPFNVCLLGMGLDAHFASIFPNTECTEYLLDNQNENLVSLIKTDQEIPYRFTMTYKTIAQSEVLVIFIRGKEKLALIDKVINSDVSIIDFPIKKIFDDYKHDLSIFWCE